MTTPYMTSDDLIESVKRKIAMPISQNTFNEDDILAFANEEMMIGQVPSMLQYHEEFFVYSDDIPLVYNVFKYPIPNRAIGMKLRDMFYVDTMGNAYETVRINPDDKSYFQVSTSASPAVHKFYCQGNEVVLVPNHNHTASGVLRMYYFIRPNKLVRDSKAMIIQSITDMGNNTTKFIVDKFPLTVNGVVDLALTNKLDILQTGAGHRIFKYDVSIINMNVGELSITISNDDVPTDLKIGDYFGRQYECIIPQIPDDLHISLSERTCARILSAQGDLQGVADINTKLQEIESRQGSLIDNRVEGSTAKVLARHTLLRNSYNRFRKI